MTHLVSSITVCDLLSSLRSSLSHASSSQLDERPAKRARTYSRRRLAAPSAHPPKVNDKLTADHQAVLADFEAVLVAAGSDMGAGMDLVSLAGRAYGAELALGELRGAVTRSAYDVLPNYTRGIVCRSHTCGMIALCGSNKVLELASARLLAHGHQDEAVVLLRALVHHASSGTLLSLKPSLLIWRSHSLTSTLFDTLRPSPALDDLLPHLNPSEVGQVITHVFADRPLSPAFASYISANLKALSPIVKKAPNVTSSSPVIRPLRPVLAPQQWISKPDIRLLKSVTAPAKAIQAVEIELGKKDDHPERGRWTTFEDSSEDELDSIPRRAPTRSGFKSGTMVRKRTLLRS